MEGSSSTQSQAVENGSSTAALEHEVEALEQEVEARKQQIDDGTAAYIKSVEDRLGVEATEELDQVMTDWKSERTSVAVVIERVKEIFQDHPDLILGFNFFLPVEQEIRPNEDLPHDQKPGW